MELPTEIITFVSTYGYLAVFLGCLLEGDILLIVASFLAYLSKLDLALVILVAFFGTWISDLSWFILGRYLRTHTLKQSSWLNKISHQSLNIANKRPRALACSLRFMYGLRMIIPLSLGRSSMKTSTFIVYNALGILIWVGVLSAFGYFFASIAETIFGRMRHLNIILPTLVVLTLILVLYARHIAEYIFRIYPKRKSK